MQDEAVTALDASSASPSDGRDEVWQPPGTLQYLVAGGHSALITELIDTFKMDTKSRLQALDDALIHGNLPLIRRHIHCIRGSASQMGASRMVTVCEQIESADSDTFTKELPGRLKELGAVYERVVRAMDVSLRIPCGSASRANAS